MIVIKYYNLYYRNETFFNDKFVEAFMVLIENATTFAHVDIAKQRIIDSKLPKECHVVVVDFVEQVV